MAHCTACEDHYRYGFISRAALRNLCSIERDEVEMRWTPAHFIYTEDMVDTYFPEEIVQ